MSARPMRRCLQVQHLHVSSGIRIRRLWPLGCCFAVSIIIWVARKDHVQCQFCQGLCYNAGLHAQVPLPPPVFVRRLAWAVNNAMVGQVQQVQHGAEGLSLDVSLQASVPSSAACEVARAQSSQAC